jgi:hypothetical protein
MPDEVDPSTDAIRFKYETDAGGPRQESAGSPGASFEASGRLVSAADVPENRREVGSLNPS